MNDTPFLAWCFFGETLPDGMPVPSDGITQYCDSDESGLLVSEWPLEALRTSLCCRGPKLCRIQRGPEMFPSRGVSTCREWTILWHIDATKLLRRFAGRCALDVVHLWSAPPAVPDYLQTGAEELREATFVALYESWWHNKHPSGFAAGAACEAARSDAWVAASFAALAAARALAWAAGSSKAGINVMIAQNAELTAMIELAHPEASHAGRQLLVVTQKLADEIWSEEFAPDHQGADATKATAAALRAAEELAQISGTPGGR